MARAGAQTSGSASFSLESTLLTGAARSTSTSFSAENCISPGAGGVSASANFSLVSGCGAALTLSQTELMVLGLVEPVPVPALSDYARYGLGMLLALAGWAALRRQRRIMARRPSHAGTSRR